ncbi:MAG TPA: AmmeMemoRadiSam system protein B [candidate division Zixibacteria bacterium]|nr:AmmeMemoRadiSam system protein B [candidate division Zixibacteria bacterium]
MKREPAVAGRFYPGTQSQLKEMIERCFLDEKIGPGELPDLNFRPTRKGDIFCLISPHAGYVYSGPVAAHGYLEQYKDGKPEFFVIIGPNHTNMGPAISVYPKGTWLTPLGEAVIPESIVEKITKQPHFRADTAAHMMEHSIEVQVPFLQYLYGSDVNIIPICLKDQSPETCERIGNVLPKVLAEYDYCLIASTDMSHYESASKAMEKDQLVIQKLKRLDSDGLLDTVMDNQISMCGPGPVSSAIRISKKLGMKNVELLKYATSGDVSGDKNAVVSYLSAIIKK